MSKIRIRSTSNGRTDSCIRRRFKDKNAQWQSMFDA